MIENILTGDGIITTTGSMSGWTGITVSGCPVYTTSMPLSTNENNKSMKEESKVLHKVVFEEVLVKQYIFEVMAKNEEDAKKIVAEEPCKIIDKTEKVLSVSREIVDIEEVE